MLTCTHTQKIPLSIGQVWAINHDVSIEQCLLSPCPARLFFSSQTKLQPAIVILLTVGSCRFGFILLKHMLQAVRPPLRKIVTWRSLPFPFLVQVNINFINLYKYMAGKAVYMLDSNIILYFFRWPTILNPFAFKNNLPFISGMVISYLILWVVPGWLFHREIQNWCPKKCQKEIHLPKYNFWYLQVSVLNFRV